MTLKRMNPDIHPPLKCAVSFGQAKGDCIWGVCEVGQWAEWQIREVKGREMSGGLRVPPVEFGYESPGTFDMF